jgi:hypothetical protein
MLTIQIRHLIRGQPRPYADHTYRTELTFEAPQSWSLPTGAQIRDLVRLLVHPFATTPDTGSIGDHFRPRLRELECIYAEQIQDPNDEHSDRLTNPLKTWSAGRREIWIAEIREPFCD